LVLKDVRINELEEQMSRLRAKVSYQRRRADRIETKYDELQADALVVLEDTRFRRNQWSNVTPLAGYTLASRRNEHGNSSGYSALRMMAGTDLQGDLKSRSIITRFEHYTAAAQRYVATCHHEDEASCAQSSASSRVSFLVANGLLRDSVAPFVAVGAGRGVKLIVESVLGIQFKGDATNQEAIGEEKVHVATLMTLFRESLTSLDSVWLKASRGDPDGNFEASESMRRQKAMCPLQKVSAGTSEELYRMILQEFLGVGCPSWEQSFGTEPQQYTADSHSPLGQLLRVEGLEAVVVGTLRAYIFNLDKGPDNVGFCRRLKEKLRTEQFTMFMVQFCFMHQYHLLVKSLLYVLDNHLPWSRVEYAFRVKYVSTVATIGNCWRGVGIGTKYKKVSVRLFGDSAAACFACTPGRCLRNRWGSIDSVEGILIKAMAYLPSVQDEVFEAALKSSELAAARKRKATVGDDEDQKWADDQKAYRVTACVSMRNPFFLATMLISHAVKTPITKFFGWSETRIKLENSRIKAARKQDGVYIGPTFLSELVAHKAAEVSDEISTLLADEDWEIVFFWNIVFLGKTV
jgi:hypothetical protein